MSLKRQIPPKGGNSTTSIDCYLHKIPRQNKSVFLTPCTKTEIKTCITRLPSKNSSGYDDISNVILKEIGDTILMPLMFIFNNLLETGVFPSDMKIADISPLFKNGSKYLLNNYRPISLLPTISKLLERIMHSRIYKLWMLITPFLKVSMDSENVTHVNMQLLNY